MPSHFDLNWAEHGGILWAGEGCAKYLAPANDLGTKIYLYDLEAHVMEYVHTEFVRMATHEECKNKVRYIPRPEV